MATFNEAISRIRELPSLAQQGIAFERLMVNYFRTEPLLVNEYDEVKRYIDWEYADGPDVGIDLVARRREDGTWTAIQCKFYQPTTYIQKSHLDSFFEASGRSFKTEQGPDQFRNRIIIATTDKWSSNAEKMLANQLIPTNRIGIGSISESHIDWDVVRPGRHLAADVTVNLTLQEKYQPRAHQAEAIARTLSGFETHDRGKLIMACGTGKTFTALRLAEDFATARGGAARVLFLVPSISLLSQTLREWTAQSKLDLHPVAVCSDSKVSKQAEDIAMYDVEVPVSTNGSVIAERLSRLTGAGLTVVFSTYQSLPAVHNAQLAGAGDFDLVICDEAHRTTGVTLAGEDPSNFTRIHDADYIHAGKRLYMTATPRLFDDAVKSKADEHSAEISSMDDEAIYGPEFYRLGFGEAVDRGLLTDYKVVVMTVDESVAADAMTNMRMVDGQELTLDLASAMIGTWNALAKRSAREQDTKSGFSSDEEPMRRTVAFAKDINTSERIAATFPALIDSFRAKLEEASLLNDISEHNIDLRVSVEHVDGGMNALTRANHLTWLKAPTESDESKMLTNARCLSEGVDVPALDSIVFFNPRNSMVDVVQSVGRVMRKSKNKDYGYIILPVAVPPNTPPSQVLNDNKRFRVVWQILNALRAHDDRFNAVVNSINLNEGNVSHLPVEVDHVGPSQDAPSAEESKNEEKQLILFSLEQWQEAMYTKLVDKVGTRTYWEDWADDVADIAEAQITRIKSILDSAPPQGRLRREFSRFVEGLRANLNDSISEDEAISMLSQHLITAPVFDALFADSDFASQNPVAIVMQRMVDALSDRQLESETESLDKFYDSVRLRAAEVNSASGKQTVIKDLYERFFKKAFRKQSDALGIVYTPVEIVDFILRSADSLSRKHFGRGLTGEGVNILDPFTGTGTFIVRLLQSGLIEPHDLARKYANELYATEIMLLAYYVAAVNIETTYQGLAEEQAKREGTEPPEYEPFTGIALADTFQISEDDDVLDGVVFKDNSERVERQKNAPIHVIVGNPPYSVGQSSANDLNANLKYPTLDRRIEETYAAKSTATNKNSLYDSYLRAFRWATDRIRDQGIVAFVSNGGWIDGNTGDGVRLSFAEDFNEIYVFNLRGNSRTAGELAKREGGNVFNVRVGVAITIAVKKRESEGCTIQYHETADGLSRDEKLDNITSANLENLKWTKIEPNEYGDWISKRSPEFETWPILGSKRRANDTESIFSEHTRGLETGRDAWIYNSSEVALRRSVQTIVETFNSAVESFDAGTSVSEFLSQNPEYADSTRIKWSSSLDSQLRRRTKTQFDSHGFVTSLYRPFMKQHAYFNDDFNHRVSQLPRIFPTPAHANIGFVVMAPREAATFATLATNLMPDLSFFTYTGQFFPRFTWEKIDVPEGELDLGSESIRAGEPSRYGVIGEELDGYRRTDNITGEIKKLYREALGSEVSGDDIFHYVYGKLHDPAYRETYAADLKKMLPHIETPTDRSEFDRVSRIGEKLMDLHVGYEDVEPWPLDVRLKTGVVPEDRETWRVTKLKWAKKTDPETGKKVNDVTTMIYNPKVTIAGIPEEADEYMLGARSALAWIIDRYQVTTDKASGIVNDPNDWADEVGNPRYIVDLIGKVTRVAVETVELVRELES